MRVGINGRFLAARMTGVQRFAREVTVRLAKRVDTTLLVPRGVVADVGIPATRIVEGALRGPLWEQLELPWAARRAGADVVLHLANASSRMLGPHVVVVHDLAPLTRPRDFRFAYRLWASWAHAGSARAAAAVATVSEQSAAEIAEYTGIPLQEIHVVRQGAGPLDAPAAPAAVAAMRSEFGLEGPYFLALGSGDARKGVPFLLEVFRRRSSDSRHGPGGEEPPSLVLVGDRYAHVHALVDSADRVVSVGHVCDEQLRALYSGRRPSSFLQNRRGSAGHPWKRSRVAHGVVVAPYGTAADVLGRAADIVPREIPRWLEALDRVNLEPAAERERRIRAGRERARRFSWDPAVAELLALCRGVVRR